LTAPSAIFVQAAKASRLTQARVWQQYDRFVSAHASRWSGVAKTALENEGERAAAAYSSAGEGAAVASVDDEKWFAYIEQLWLATVPEAGEVIMPFLAAAKVFRVIVVKASPAEFLLEAAVNWIKANGVREATMLSNTSRKGIANQIRIGISKNESQEQIAARIRKQYRSVSESRADTIARTEVHAASNYGSLSAAAESEQSLDKIWVDTPDGRVRDAHVLASGQKKSLRSAFLVDGERLMHPGDTSLGASAENLANCFPADTEVSAELIRACYRRWYEGPLIEIETAAGHKLSGTPNHPILTSRGWVALGLLKETDEVLCSGVRDRIVLSSPDVKTVPSTIGEFFDAHIATGQRVVASGVDFHGDVADGDVDIVLADGQLGCADEAFGFQHVHEYGLAAPHEMKRSLATEGDAFGSLLADRLAHGAISGRDEMLALFKGHFAHSENVGFTATSSGDAALDEHVRDYFSRNAELSGNFLLRRSTGIGSDSFPVETVTDARLPRSAQCVALASAGNAESVEPSKDGGCAYAVVSADQASAQSGCIEFRQFFDGRSWHGSRSIPFQENLLRCADDTEFVQPSLHGSVADAIGFGHLVTAGGFFVEAAKVVRIGRRKFCGHVYNLETSTGWYLANNIIAHNCRCFLFYVAAQRAVPNRPRRAA
jgi:hypothetical protein